jgi:hypothetical protein
MTKFNIIAFIFDTVTPVEPVCARTKIRENVCSKKKDVVTRYAVHALRNGSKQFDRCQAQLEDVIRCCFFSSGRETVSVNINHYKYFTQASCRSVIYL